MKTRQSKQGRLRVPTHTKASIKQSDKQDIMATEQGNISEAIAQVVAEAVGVVKQAMAMASTDNNQRHRMQDPN